jgi:hypothetical protein
MQLLNIIRNILYFWQGALGITDRAAFLLLDKQNSKHLMTTSNRALPLYNGNQDYKCTHILFFSNLQ